MNGLKYWTTKATFTSGTDLTSKGALSPEQTKEFLRVAIASSILMKDARIETSSATAFEVPRVDFGSRLLKVGTEATRLTDSDRIKPTTALVSLATYLFKGETLVSDEALEDSVEGAGIANTFMTMIAEAVGRDVEELALLNNTARVTADTGHAAELDVFTGLVQQLVGVSEAATTGMVTPAGQNIADASTYTTFDSLFAKMIENLPSQYKRNMRELMFYVSVQKFDRYAESLGARGTGVGDKVLIDGMELRYRGIPVKGIPMLTGTHTINTAAMVYDNVAFLTPPKNIIFGFHRKIRVEKYRDPREGATSFLPSVRFDAKIADPNALSTAKKISAL